MLLNVDLTKEEYLLLATLIDLKKSELKKEGTDTIHLDELANKLFNTKTIKNTC